MFIPQTEIILSTNGVELMRRTVGPGDYVIGRDAAAEIFVDVEGVSLRHGQLTVNYDEIFIEDLGGGSGVLVAGRPVSGCTRLWPNQKVQLGPVVLETRRIKPLGDGDETLSPRQDAVRRVLPEEFLREKKYEIGGVIAQGGMGAILDAREATTHRTVAMKVMLSSLSENDLLRFIEEAQVTSQLEHPNIVPIYELNVDENGQVFYTMKLVQGVTLRKVLEGLRGGDSAALAKYPLAALLTTFQKVCDAMAFAHSKGVIHRDLKPENVMLGDYGEVLVMDWGLAKVLGKTREPREEGARPVQRIGISSARTEDAGSLTMAGSIVGTPQYMAPEQARGDVETLDARTDIYALGAILYHLLALRPSIAGDDGLQIVGKVARGEIEPLSPSSKTRPIPDSLAAVCRKAMALDPAARYQSVPALQAEIQAFQNGFATSAEKAGAWRQFTLLLMRNKAASLGIAAVLLVGATFGAKALAEGRRAARTLGELRSTAPEFAARAVELFANEKFDEADRKLDYAIVLDPKSIAYRLTKANFYEDQLRLADATKVLREILTLDPNNARAREHAALCEQLERTRGADGKLPRAVLAELLERMTKEGRSPSEKFAVAKQLGQENEAVREVWLEKLKGLPTGNLALKVRLVLTAEGRMRLNLWDTTLSDLSPLRGMPLRELDISRTLVTDLGPLKGMRLQAFTAIGCHLTDITALAGMPLRDLNLNANKITDLSPLAGMPLDRLELSENPVEDLSPLHGMPLTYLDINGSKPPDLEALRGMALHDLNLTNVQSIEDLSPLLGMPLHFMQFYGNRIADLEPLRKSPLEVLFIGDCQEIKDISPIAQPKLRRLSLTGCAAVVDLRPLAVCTELEELVLPPNARDIAFLRALPKLRKLNYKADMYGSQWTTMTAEEFWKKFDAKK